MPRLQTTSKILAAAVLAAAAMLTTVVSAQASTMYCNSRLVQVGDPTWQVGRACPQPFWREDRDEPAARTRDGQVLGWHRVEIWTLNFGASRFMRQLVFRDGYLYRIDQLGYGVRWQPGSRRCSWRELDQAGTTAAEVFAHCGEPDYRYNLSPLAGFGGYAGPWSGHGQRERWVYDFADGRRVRELDFVNGRLERIQRGRH